MAENIKLYQAAENEIEEITKLYEQAKGSEYCTWDEHYPNIEMISVGPTIRNAHSPDEKVQISTVQTYWELLTKVLADIK